MDDAEGEFLVADRIQKIRQVIGEYGEKKFAIAFSGGKDSCVLSTLIDEALPGNTIPRVYVNTGIEYNLMVRFVRRLAQIDDRIVIIKSGVNIPKMLQEVGFPFKSKEHSKKVSQYQRTKNLTPYLQHYLSGDLGKLKTLKRSKHSCPKALHYQFTSECTLKISDLCCEHLKKRPMNFFLGGVGKTWRITGISAYEGGQRQNANCLNIPKSKNKIASFNPLMPITAEWERYYIETRNIQLCELYYPPYNMERTGCKGCPFNPKLQKGLDMLAEYLPAERRQCERIWKPVYDEYRRIGYRLTKRDENLTGQLDLFGEDVAI